MKLKGELKTSLNDNHKDDKEILVGEEFPYRWTSIRIFRKLLSTDLDSFFELLTSLLFLFCFPRYSWYFAYDRFQDQTERCTYGFCGD